MKLTQEQLRKIILEEIEEGLFDKAMGAVSGAAKGAVSGFKQGGVKGAIAGAQQQAASEAEKKSLQGDFTKLVNLAKEMQKQSAKDPKIGQVSKQLGYFLNSIKSNLEKLGVQTPATGMYEEQAQPQQPQSTVGKAKQFASAVGTAVSDRMKRTPIVAAADSLLTSIIKMQKAAGQDQAKLQVLDKIQTDLNNILKHLGSVGQHSAVIKTQQTPVQEKRITRHTLSQIIKEELEEIMSEGSDTTKMTLQGKPVTLMVKRFGRNNFVTIYDVRLEEIAKYQVSLPDPKTGGSPLIEHMSGQDFESNSKEWQKIQSAMMKLVSGGLNENNVKVTISSNDQSQEKMIQKAASDFNMQYPLEIDGKKYIYQQLSSGLKLFNPDNSFVEYWRTSGRSEKPKTVEDPQVLAKATSMLQKKSKRR